MYKSIKLKTILFLAVSISFQFVNTAEAQEAKKLENVKWYSVSFVKFKTGTAEEARKIIHEHFMPVDKVIGREIFNVDFVTGDWDHIVAFHIDGPGELTWERSPTGTKWWSAFVKRMGSEKSAEALYQKYNDTIIASKQEIGYHKIIE
jgi:hypothetical protein